MKLSDYDNAILVAKNDNGDTLHIVTFGNITRYCVTYKNQESFTTGDIYENKTHYVSKAFDFALSSFCGCFNQGDVLTKYPRNRVITITENETVALNTAIKLLNNSNSDHADQCLCYLNTLKNKLYK